ncbi:hypothetical protein GCM10022243_20190 [Saccharothrix violaceirubra]|uniref:Uncharacterized protein n=1 Tax=Saccharothrix violaceirubra TaxID=413306 RepID=A0A7W7T1X8_9PSEU|nr:hypothetical protein [Saccharothrix violaceirubra]MBB4965077.1 hypothetical protein [Saccharothrix violaceirubra]
MMKSLIVAALLATLVPAPPASAAAYTVPRSATASGRGTSEANAEARARYNARVAVLAVGVDCVDWTSQLVVPTERTRQNEWTALVAVDALCVA